MSSRRRRRALAIALAIGAHGVVAFLVTRAHVRPLERARSSARLEITVLAQKPAASVPVVSAPVVSAPVVSAPVLSEPVVSAPDVSAPSAPVVSAPPPSTPANATTPTGESVVRRDTRSFLDRVLQGTSGGPQPSLEALDPKQSDMDRARRVIEGVARVDAPSVDAGPVRIELVARDDGGFTYETGGFVADINVDGSVTFMDKGTSAGVGKGSNLPRKGPQNPYGEGFVERTPAVASTAHAGTVNGSALGASFDPTAALLRAQGQDPYEAEKSCFLDDTRDLRSDLKVKHDSLQLGRLRRDLEKAWFDDKQHSVAERRAALFAIWDECREDGIGVKARELVESFVRQHLPRDSADAYSEDELLALNTKRTSTAEFRPYG